MRSHTQSARLPASFDIVFSFLSEPANLPKWATAFCQSVRREADRWFGQTGAGEIEISYVCDARHGIVDIMWRPVGGAANVAYTRLLRNGDECEYVFTFFQPPDSTDAQFEAQAAALQKELQVLRSVAATLGACPT